MEIKKVITYNGRKYRLSKTNPKYYYADIYNGTGKKGRKKKALHHAVWEDGTGKKIPKGYCIHHKNGNCFNNAFENLELMDRGEHQRMNMLQRFKDPLFREKNKQQLASAGDKAAVWHKSKDGSIWHKKHYEESLGQAKKYKHICEYCGKDFESGWKVKARFCSYKCGYTFRNHNIQIQA